MQKLRVFDSTHFARGTIFVQIITAGMLEEF